MLSRPQMVYSFKEEGGIPKVIANTIAIAPGGDWLLPFWRENDPWDASTLCNQQPQLMGVPGVLLSSDKVREGPPANPGSLNPKPRRYRCTTLFSDSIEVLFKLQSAP